MSTVSYTLEFYYLAFFISILLITSLDAYLQEMTHFTHFSQFGVTQLLHRKISLTKEDESIWYTHPYQTDGGSC